MITEPHAHSDMASEGKPGPDAHLEEFFPLLEDYEAALRRGELVEPSQWLGKHYPVPRKLRSSLEELYWLHWAGQRERAVPAAIPADLPQVPGYEILEELGRGGMGVVYKARQLRPERFVALKTILDPNYANPEALARFRTEPEAIARLGHPNIVQVYEVGEHQHRPFFSMEYVEGGSLDKNLGGTPQPPRHAAELVEALARSMQVVHEKNIVHRDLKPSNVLLTLEGIPKITDFGLAKRLNEDLGQTQSGAVLGTASYMAPEQASGKTEAIGRLADVYALGAILYETLTGRPPFKGATVLDTLELVRSQEPVPPRRLQPKVPRDLETICLKCLQKEPRDRYPSAGALAKDLNCFLAGESIRFQRIPRWVRAFRWVWRQLAAARGWLARLVRRARGKTARTEELDPRPRAEGVVEYFHGNQARCLVDIDGMSLPVNLPAAALRSHGLTENMRFAWRMQDDGSVRPRDLRPLPDPQLSTEERQELDKRYQADRDDSASDVWNNLLDD